MDFAKGKHKKNLHVCTIPDRSRPADPAIVSPGISCSIWQAALGLFVVRLSIIDNFQSLQKKQRKNTKKKSTNPNPPPFFCLCMCTPCVTVLLLTLVFLSYHFSSDHTRFCQKCKFRLLHRETNDRRPSSCPSRALQSHPVPFLSVRIFENGFLFLVFLFFCVND